MKMLKAVAVVSAIMIAGCAGNKEIIEKTKVSVREDVFQKVESKVAPVAGYADVHISASIKTHRDGLYILEKSGHGNQNFQLVINIDGQVLPLQGEMRQEKGDYVGERDPEAGVGTRYIFNQTLRLKPGAHTMTVAIPDDDVVLKQEVNLKEGENTLKIKPVYKNTNRKRRIGFLGDTSYSEGIKTVQMIVNN